MKRVKKNAKKKLDGLTNQEAEVITRRRALRLARLKKPLLGVSSPWIVVWFIKGKTLAMQGLS